MKYSVKVKENKKEIDRIILNNISGICKSGEITAILGASGAGKAINLFDF